MPRYSKLCILSLLLVPLSYLLSLVDVRYDQLLTDEDSWIENIGALAFLAAAIWLVICFVRSKEDGNDFIVFRTNRNWIYLVLSLLFFVAFGEEISWGQRIFGWSTPEAYSAMNYQQETNLHNLDFFTFKDETSDQWYAPLLVFNAGRLFFYFWFIFMVLTPLLYFMHGGFRRFIKRINVPIPPAWTGMQMLSALILAKVYKLLFKGMPGDHAGSIDEIMEFNYALIIAAMAYAFYKRSKIPEEDLATDMRTTLAKG